MKNEMKNEKKWKSVQNERNDDEDAHGKNLRILYYIGTGVGYAALYFLAYKVSKLMFLKSRGGYFIFFNLVPPTTPPERSRPFILEFKANSEKIP